MKKVLILLPLLIFMMTTPAHAASSVFEKGMMEWMYENPLLVLSGIVVMIALWVIWRQFESIAHYQKVNYLKAHGIEYAPEKSPSIMENVSGIFNKLSGLLPAEKEQDIELDHEYDGIRELDNRLPPWWLYLFYFTIIFGVGYLYIYHFSDIGKSQSEEYEMQMEQGREQQILYASMQKNSIDEENLVAITDASQIGEGQGVFISVCAACHGADGRGGVGPNLTDDYWIHGGHIKSIYQTIKNGVPEKGMIAWKAQLEPATIHKVASFIKTLRGSNPPEAKAQEGELYVEEGGVSEAVLEPGSN